MWPMCNTVAMQRTGENDGNGLATYNVGGTFTVMANPFCAAFELAKRGWNLLEVRGTVWHRPFFFDGQGGTRLCHGVRRRGREGALPLGLLLSAEMFGCYVVSAA
jgi:hypothetical protein